MRTAIKAYLSDSQMDRVERILSAAKELIGEVGIEGMTMRDLAERSRVAPATLYNRFGSKDAVISLALFDHYETNVNDRLVDADDGVSDIERLLRMVDLIGREVLDQKSLSRAIAAMYFKPGDNREHSERIHGALMSTLLPLLEGMAAGGRIDPELLPPQALARELADRLFGVIFQWSIGRVADQELASRLSIGTLLTLLGVSVGEQRSAIQGILKASPA